MLIHGHHEGGARTSVLMLFSCNRMRTSSALAAAGDAERKILPDRGAMGE